MSKIIVIGGGAAGMFAAISAAENGHEVHLYEQNEKLGKKLYITGKGRCNITNACDPETMLRHVCTNDKFLYSSGYGYDSSQVIAFLEAAGLHTKIERGNRVFPVSDHSSDVIKTLESAMKKRGVQIHLNAKVKDIIIEAKQCKGIVLSGQKQVAGDYFIVATGGLSYPTTGSTGDGYQFAKKMNHKVTRLWPSLVPLEAKEEYAAQLQGLSLKNVEVSIKDGKKELFRELGEMLFTHFGVSGPLILTASSTVVPLLEDRELTLYIDLKPGLTEEQLDRRLLKDFGECKNKQFKNALDHLLPQKMIPVVITLSGISAAKKVNEVSREERLKLLQIIKGLPLTLTGSRGFREAIITKGGVAVKEIDPSTMRSKKAGNVCFVGEILDLDALTGGFNLQIAWATAYAAGNNIE